jgi:magnesium-transporting ATPase (P-type)
LVFYVSFNILGNSVEVARTTALVCLIVLEVASAFNFRSFRQKTLTRSPFVNPYLVVASTVSILATLAVVYTTFFRRVFETAAIGVNQWIVAVIAGFILLIIFDTVKYISRKKNILMAAINK